MTRLLKDTRSVLHATEAEWEVGMASMERPAFVVANDPRATPEMVSCERRMIADAGIKHLSAIVGDLNDLIENPIVDDEGDEIITTDYAYTLCCGLLIDAAVLIALARAGSPDTQVRGMVVPAAVVSSDERGGIRVEWVRDNASVHFVVPASDDSHAYIYTEVGNVYGTQQPATAELLAASLRHIA